MENGGEWLELCSSHGVPCSLLDTQLFLIWWKLKSSFCLREHAKAYGRSGDAASHTLPEALDGQNWMLPISGQRLALAAWYLQYLLSRNMGSSTTQSGHSRGENSLFLPEIWTHNYVTLHAELSWLLSGFGGVEKHVSILAKIPYSFINWINLAPTQCRASSFV